MLLLGIIIVRVSRLVLEIFFLTVFCLGVLGVPFRITMSSLVLWLFMFVFLFVELVVLFFNVCMHLPCLCVFYLNCVYHLCVSSCCFGIVVVCCFVMFVVVLL